MSASKRIIAADIFALIMFGIFIGGTVEVLSGLLSGLAFQQAFLNMVYSRGLSIPVNLTIARPYGIFRDWVMKITGAENSTNEVFRTVTDTAAFILFQLPVYVVILVITGWAWDAIVSASVGAVFTMIATARPYGLWMQFCRNRFVPASMMAAA
ncbi:L-alanine exporter AlaE [Sansalvadorimonas sp. 2012CJ34-2]|uniref:L-alanine exporter AlaE n=1 Tax=Parendozoicomonas callyspongiae TaxID=2942213 RepID=A0ABT0PDJ7_9GAMM|nr:L-alanine exporter AlaE [Sansalvadorimonas sp. 2012CJ34-2]MCL6269430.1 L-alanine exporter AlaE [Sansalvadorimonas sp. 2012CJ34-2]